MNTSIFTTKKLEKTTRKIIVEKSIDNLSPLGKWNANIFYIDRKKCWLIVNSKTKYMLVLAGVTAVDLKNITTIFRETFYAQLIYDGIIIDYHKIDHLLGDILVHKTDNDRSANGSLNYALGDFDYWHYEFGHFENMNFRNLNARLNNTPNEMFDYDLPKNIMAELLQNL